MFKKIVLAVCSLIILLGISGFFIPHTVKLDRYIDIDTPLKHIYKTLIRPSESKNWSPWVDQDANIKLKYEGPTAGEGSKIYWKSSVVGNGSQEWIECMHERHVKTKIFFAGNDHPNYTTFYLEEFEGYTEVTWEYQADYGTNPYKRYVGLFIEQIMGDDIEKGLHKMKKYIESKGYQEEELDVELEADILDDSLRSVQNIDSIQ